MSQITINVQLTTQGEEDVLLFLLDDNNPEMYALNLNSDNNQVEIKKIFSKILELLINDDILLDFSIAEGYSKGLYKDVCSEYVAELQKEISSVKESLLREM
ncbi:MAG: hypothetical protein U0L18_11560 [Acutalibacteraceae bacterium]|nr:hypothetical protein [Acutalibacteraceae bacterium]